MTSDTEKKAALAALREAWAALVQAREAKIDYIDVSLRIAIGSTLDAIADLES